MWSLILYFLFDIGQPANKQVTSDNITVHSETSDTDDGDGGDKGNVRPPNP